LAPCLSLGAIFGNLDFDLNPGWRCTENSASFADRRNNALGQRQIGILHWPINLVSL
jgi:hypothetical protein